MAPVKFFLFIKILSFQISILVLSTICENSFFPVIRSGGRLILLTLFWFLVVFEFTKHYNVVYGLWVLPATKDEQMRTDGCCGVPVPCTRRISNVKTTGPAHWFCWPDHKVLCVLFQNNVAFFLRRFICPPTKHKDFTTTDVQCVAIASARWGAADTKARPHIGFSVDHSDVVDVATLDWSSLCETCCLKLICF